MKKYLVETYYTCTFKTVHSLNELNEKSMSDIDDRDDGTVEVIEVKLNNRKTKKIGQGKKEKIKKVEMKNTLTENISNNIQSTKNLTNETQNYQKIKNKARFKMPDRRKGYIQKAQIGDH